MMAGSMIVGSTRWSTSKNEREVARTVRAVCPVRVAVVFEEFRLLSPEILCALSRRFSVS